MLSLACMSLNATANDLANTDFQKGLSDWHGDGEIAYLKTDGTEGTETDPDVTPVMKIVLSRSRTLAVYQEFDTRDAKPTNMHVTVDVYASADFVRSKFASDYSIKWKPGGTWYWSAIAIPDVDFWIRGGPGWFYKLIDLKPGSWSKLDGRFEGLMESDSHVMNFCVPPGQGTIYLKNPSVE